MLNHLQTFFLQVLILEDLSEPRVGSREHTAPSGSFRGGLQSSSFFPSFPLPAAAFSSGSLAVPEQVQSITSAVIVSHSATNCKPDLCDYVRSGRLGCQETEAGASRGDFSRGVYGSSGGSLNGMAMDLRLPGTRIRRPSGTVRNAMPHA